MKNSINNITEFILGRTIICWYKTLQWKKSLHDKMIKNFPKQIIDWFNYKEIHLIDGTTIYFFEAIDGSIGCRYDTAYVEPCIEPKFIETVIKPMANCQIYSIACTEDKQLL